MTNGANDKRGKLHHSPWYSDIRTSKQLNTPPGLLSHPFQTKHSKQEKTGANQTAWISSNQTWRINFHSDGIPDAVSSSDTISVRISLHIKAISDVITKFNPETISKTNSNHSHCYTLLQEGGLWQWPFETVREHLSSWYVVHVDLSNSCHICRRIVHGRNVCNCSCEVDSVLDARD